MCVCLSVYVCVCVYARTTSVSREPTAKESSLFGEVGVCDSRGRKHAFLKVNIEYVYNSVSFVLAKVQNVF